MTDYTPAKSGGAAPFTSTASGTVYGGRLVTANGDGTVALSTTGNHAVGVAGHDAVSGASVTVYPLANVTHQTQIENGETVAAGGPVIAGATGYVKSGTLATVAAAGTLLGIILSGGTGSDATPVYATWIGTG